MGRNSQLVASALSLSMLLYAALSCGIPPPPPSPSPTAPTPSTAAPTPTLSITAPTPSTTGLPPPIENIPPPPAGGGGGGSAPIGGVEMNKCWSSIQRVEGCFLEIYRAIIRFRFENIGPVCCKVIVAIDDNCWPNIFPFAPQLATLLKTKCDPQPEFMHDV